MNAQQYQSLPPDSASSDCVDERNRAEVSAAVGQRSCREGQVSCNASVNVDRPSETLS